jgi:hypothetical protein
VIGAAAIRLQRGAIRLALSDERDPLVTARERFVQPAMVAMQQLLRGIALRDRQSSTCS